MAYLFSDSLDDAPGFEAVEGVRGMDGFSPAAGLPPDLAQYLENVVINDLLRPGTRPGADALGEEAFDEGAVQGLGWFSVPGGQKLVAVVGGTAYAWDGNSKVAVSGFEPDAGAPVMMVQGMSRLFAVDGAGPLRFFDGTEFREVVPGAPSASGSAPPGGSVLCWHSSRLFLSGVATEPDTIWVSGILATDVGDWNHAQFSFQAGGGEGGVVVGLASLPNFGLGVLKDDSVLVYVTDPQAASAAEWPLVFRAEVGCVGRRAFCVVGSDLHFMTSEGVRSLGRMAGSGGDWEVQPPFSRPVQPWIDRINWAFAHRICAVKYRHLVLWGVPLDGFEWPSHVLVWNARTGAWMGVWTGWGPTVFGVTRFNGEQRLVFGDGAGRVNVWKDSVAEAGLEGTYLDNGEPIGTRMKLRGFAFGEPVSRKDPEAFVVRFVDTAVAVGVDVYQDDSVTRSFEFNLADEGEGLPLDLPFDLSTDKPATRGAWLTGAEEFLEQWFEVRATEGRVVLRSLKAAAFLNPVELPE